jgi:hypothetical protein
LTKLQRRILRAAVEKAKPWLRRKGVVAVGIGQARRGGDWVEGGAHVVVKVEWKLEADALERSRREPLPRFIEVTVDGRRHRVSVDVQDTQGQLAGKLQGCAGAAVTIDGVLRGGAGPVVRSARGPRLLISGHVAARAAVLVQVGGLPGQTEKPIMSRDLDHCLVAPAVAPPADWASLVDGTPLTGVAAVEHLVLGQRLYFHHSQTGKRVPVVLRDLDVAVPFECHDGIQRVQHLLGTDGGSVMGDSGTLLYDSSFAAVGTLVGALGDRSYFIACQRAFELLGLSLIIGI